MYGKNGTKIVVYNVRRCPKKRRLKKTDRKKINKYDTKGRTPDSWLYYSGNAEDDFYILYLQLFFQTIHDHYLLSKIRLVLFLTLYKFIVWACWARTQSCFGFQVRTVLTYRYTINKIMHLNKAKKKKPQTNLPMCADGHFCPCALAHFLSSFFTLFWGKKIVGES